MFTEKITPYILVKGKAVAFTNVYYTLRSNGNRIHLTKTPNNKDVFVEFCVDADCDGTFYYTWIHLDFEYNPNEMDVKCLEFAPENYVLGILDHLRRSNQY